ncbi:helix-turn-helix domain-containing protein [Candidatus Pelagibacter sp.]|jgi:hypothetical protein|nr:helix-turn-helix domain-containing protein [Candidatus Pelagibacter sp.]
MNTDFDILRDITQEVCKADPMKKTRKREVVYARMIMYKVLKSFHKHTATSIGRMFGKNHATILHSINQFDNMVSYDDWLNNRFHCVMSEYTKEISLQNEIIADVHLKNKILESKVKTQKRIIRQCKEISSIIDGVPEAKVGQIIQKLRMLSEIAKKEIKPRNQQTVVYNSNIVSHE